MIVVLLVILCAIGYSNLVGYWVELGYYGNGGRSCVGVAPYCVCCFILVLLAFIDMELLWVNVITICSWTIPVNCCGYTWWDFAVFDVCWPGYISVCAGGVGIVCSTLYYFSYRFTVYLVGIGCYWVLLFSLAVYGVLTITGVVIAVDALNTLMVALYGWFMCSMVTMLGEWVL